MKAPRTCRPRFGRLLGCLRGAAFGELRGDFRDDAFARVKWQYQDEADFNLLGADTCPYKREGRARKARPASWSLAEKGRKRRYQKIYPVGYKDRVRAVEVGMFRRGGNSLLGSFLLLCCTFGLSFCSVCVCVYVMYIYNIYIHTFFALYHSFVCF